MLLSLARVGLGLIPIVQALYFDCGPIPDPEPIEVFELPLPPVSPSDDVGSCTTEVNPRGTGCINGATEAYSGSFLPDDIHVISSVNYTGSTTDSIYSGEHVIIIKTNGETFPNGDPWKCITCGTGFVGSTTQVLDYPQAFTDGKRLLANTFIVESDELFASEASTPNNTHVYPLHFSTSVNGSGPGAPIRELRVHPDQVHLGFNLFSFEGGQLGQNAFNARLEFNPSPGVGEPRSPRYDLTHVWQFANKDNTPQIRVEGDQMYFNDTVIQIGEWRGWTGRGDECLSTAFFESDNVDIISNRLSDGRVRRLTSLPGYADPVDVSKDGKWTVVLDTRGTNRTNWYDGLRGVPPINDLVLAGTVASLRNNLDRRFFQPWLLDFCGDRAGYGGQQINAAGDGTANSINDPNWNARSDPRWSWDGTKIVYHQALVVSPSCGGDNPLPCPTPPNGREYRIMVANLTSRSPVPYEPVAVIPDSFPWGTPYDAAIGPVHSSNIIPTGNYTLYGHSAGYANVTVTLNGTRIQSVAADYVGYSDDGLNYINGWENATVIPLNATYFLTDWYSNLTSTAGNTYNTKITSPGGLHLGLDYNYPQVLAQGSLTTTIDGVEYKQPPNRT